MPFEFLTCACIIYFFKKPGFYKSEIYLKGFKLKVYESFKGRRFWEDSRIGSTSNLSPNLHKKLHWHNVWFNYCGTLDSVEVLSLPRKTWVVKLRLNSALHTVAAAHLPPLPIWQEAVYMFLEQLTHCLWESDWGKSTLSFKYQGTVLRSLIAASDQRGRQTGEQPLLLYLPWLLQAPLILTKVTSRGYKGPEPSPLHFSHLPLLGARH